MEASCAHEEALSTSIDQNRKGRVTKKIINPLYPSFIKPKLAQNADEEGPVHSVKSFHHV